MTYIITWMFASHLVWGKVEVGAQSYRPNQTSGKYDDCTHHKCVAPCAVTEITQRPTDLQWLVTLECK